MILNNYLKYIFIFIILFYFHFLIRFLGVFETESKDIFTKYIPPHDSFCEIRAAIEKINPYYPEKIDNYVPNTPYKYFLRVIFKFFNDQDNYLKYVRIIQIIISALMIPFLLFIGSYYGNNITGFLCCLFWVFNSDMLLYDSQILKYSITFSIIILGIFAFIQFNIKPDFKRFLLLFILIILLSLLRPIYFMLIFFIIKPLIKRYYPIYNNLYNLLLIIIIPALIFFLVIFLPSESKNHLSIHIYKGFNQFSNGFYSDLPYVRDNTIGHFQEGNILQKELSSKYPRYNIINNFWLQKAISYIADYPFSAIRLIIKKFYKLFFITDWNDTEDILYMTENFTAFKLAFIKYEYLIIFSLIGFISQFLYKRKNSSFYIINIFFIIPVISVIFTCLSKRYQAHLVPVLCVFAGIGINNIILLFKKNSWNKILIIIFSIVIIFDLIIYNKEIYNNFKVTDRVDYLLFRIDHNLKADRIFIPWIKNNIQPKFEDIKKAWFLYNESLNTIDALGLLKKFKEIAKTDDETFWLYKSTAETYITQEFYTEALIYLEKAYNLKQDSNLFERIKFVKTQSYLSKDPYSYP